MSTSLFLSFRPHGSGASRVVESLLALQSPAGFQKLLRVDFNAAAYLAADQTRWYFKEQASEDPERESEEFPLEPLTTVLSKHLDPFDALLAARELELRWDTYVEELGDFITELQREGEDTFHFFPHRKLTAFSKARSGAVEWA